MINITKNRCRQHLASRRTGTVGLASGTYQVIHYTLLAKLVQSQQRVYVNHIQSDIGSPYFLISLR